MDIAPGTTIGQCEDMLYSEDYAAFIVDFRGGIQDIRERYNAYCVLVVNEKQAIILVGFPSTVVGYQAIPRVYGLLDTSSMEKSGVLRLRRQPYIELLGQGVIIGFIDTGIDYTHPVFKNADNTTRIISIWDQNNREGNPPENLIYGTEYSQEQINQALASENPLEVVPSTDPLGHGTFMAGIAAGNQDEENDFTGAAPSADIAVVKLKQCKQILRDFFYVPDEVPCYSEYDIMFGVRYLLDVASKYNKPLVICLGVGTNLGDHTGSAPLAEYLDMVGERQGRVVVCAAGNEGNAGHHYESTTLAEGKSEDVEITVAENEKGFFLELWATVPHLFSVGFISPGGEYISKIPARLGESETIRFLLEETVVHVDYQIVEIRSGDELISMRFEKPTPGIWRIRVFNESEFGGQYNMWLPIVGFIEDKTYFIRSNPDITICEPANGRLAITTAAYNHENDSLYINSSRGFTRSGRVKPEITAPGVEVFGPVPGGGFSTRTGTSVAAAHTAGAAALLLEWGVVKGNDLDMNSITVARYLIRGAKRINIVYPNREWGYGMLDIFQAFSNLRTTQ